jgi:hypothetical protein
MSLKFAFLVKYMLGLQFWVCVGKFGEKKNSLNLLEMPLVGREAESIATCQQVGLLEVKVSRTGWVPFGKSYLFG